MRARDALIQGARPCAVVSQQVRSLRVSPTVSVILSSPCSFRKACLRPHLEALLRVVGQFQFWICRATCYWERGRPRLQSVRSTLKSSHDWTTSKQSCSRFALNAGEGARAPSHKSCRKHPIDPLPFFASSCALSKCNQRTVRPQFRLRELSPKSIDQLVSSGQTMRDFPQR